jgi:hypothetical protein
MLRWLACVSFASAGCDEAWDLEHISPPERACTDFAVHDEFTAEPACGSWGTIAKRDAELVVAGGQLSITTSVPGGYGTCTAILPALVPESGIFIEVSAMMQGDAWFGLKNGTESLLLFARDGELRLSTTSQTYGRKPWDAVLMRWWRLRPDVAADRFVAEYSRDGVVWELLAAGLPWALDQSVQLTLGAGIADQTTPQTTTFEGVNACP